MVPMVTLGFLNNFGGGDRFRRFARELQRHSQVGSHLLPTQLLQPRGSHAARHLPQTDHWRTAPLGLGADPAKQGKSALLEFGNRRKPGSQFPRLGEVTERAECRNFARDEGHPGTHVALDHRLSDIGFGRDDRSELRDVHAVVDPQDRAHFIRSAARGRDQPEYAVREAGRARGSVGRSRTTSSATRRRRGRVGEQANVLRGRHGVVTALGLPVKAVAYGLLALVVATGLPIVPLPVPPPVRNLHFASSHLSLVAGRRAGIGCEVTQGVSVPAGAPGGVSFPVAYNPVSCMTLWRVGILGASENQPTTADRDCYVLKLQSGKVAVTPPGYKCIKIILPDGRTFIRNLAGTGGK